MTTFQDGSAKGRAFFLSRSPHFLRVVTDGSTWAALDKLEDKPAADEAIYVYRRIDRAGVMHIGCRGSESRTYSSTDYALVNPAPPDSEIRTTDHWRRWTREQIASKREERRDVAT